MKWSKSSLESESESSSPEDEEEDPDEELEEPDEPEEDDPDPAEDEDAEPEAALFGGILALANQLGPSQHLTLFSCSGFNTFYKFLTLIWFLCYCLFFGFLNLSLVRLK